MEKAQLKNSCTGKWARPWKSACMCLSKSSAVQFLVCSLSICNSCYCDKLSDFFGLLVSIFQTPLNIEVLASTVYKENTDKNESSKVKERSCGGVENWTCIYHVSRHCLTWWISSVLSPFLPLWQLFFPCRCGNWELAALLVSASLEEKATVLTLWNGSGHTKYPGCAQFLHTYTSETAWDASHNKITWECQQRIGVITQTLLLPSPLFKNIILSHILIDIS